MFSVSDTVLKQDTNRRPLKMAFPVPVSSEVLESAALRLLVPPQPSTSGTVQIHVSQILGARRTRLLGEETLYVSRNLTKWCQVDVTTAVASWLSGRKNLGLEIVCIGCSNNLVPKEAAITALVHKSHRRVKRSVSKGITDCSARHHNGKGKKKCCRHEMNVTFTKLGFREMKNIIEPKAFEAGYCQGMCPLNYNLATNHSKIQGLMHQLDKRNAKLLKHRTELVPKTCCAPSKLGDLEILIVDSEDSTKLKLETWQNMRVLECACS